MVSYLLKQARKDQLQDELGSLRTEFAAWLQGRKDSDSRKQYMTQLNALEDLISGTLRALQPDLDACEPSLEMGEFYEECRLLDQRIVWLRRIWQFFKEKFDQRDDERLGPMLQAADEVVWSCYRPLFESSKLLGRAIESGPAPLPFIEPLYSPEAFPIELVPGDLKDSLIGKDFLRIYLNKLPLPVVRLPPTSILAPWMLVLIGHETGHHLQHDLGLVGWFREQVERVVRGQGGTADEVARWKSWSQEIFADIFSVLVMGPWAVLAMAELELSTTVVMLTPRTRYPAPAVRLQLLAETAACLGMDGSAMLQFYGIDLRALLESSSEASRDCAFLRPIISLALGPLPLPDFPLNLAQLLAFRKEEFAERGAVQRWSAALLDQNEGHSEQTLRAPRLLASATLQAWSHLAILPDEQNRTYLRKKLTKQAVDAILRNHELAPREAGPAGMATDIGVGLAELLRQAGRNQMESEVL